MRRNQRKGAIALLLCLIMVPVLILFAFSVDYGFLLYIRTDLQRAADNAALAAVYELVPDDDGVQDFDRARQAAKDYIAKNLGNEFKLLDEDIEIGRFNTKKIYESVELLDSGIRDTVRVTIRRSELTNKSVFLYFAKMFDKNKANVEASATAVLQKGRYLGPGTDILPITVSEQSWQRIASGESFSIYGDGGLTDSRGYTIPGNWGTVDIGANSNSSSDLMDQISVGISQSDLDFLASNNVITSNKYIDSQDTIKPNGDTGFSAGIKNAINTQFGRTKLIPIYKQTSGQGGNLTFTIVGWGVVRLEQADWNGNKNTRLDVTKGYMYDRDIVPLGSLSDTLNVIDGVFTSPALVE